MIRPSSFFILGVLVVSFSFSNEQNTKSETFSENKKSIIDQAFGSAKEIYFSFSFESKDQLNELTKIISIDNIANDIVFAYANREDFNKFLSTKINYQILDHPNAFFKADIYDSKLKQTYAWDQYLTYNDYVNMIYQFAIDYPDICQVFSIGQSVEGRELLVAKISDNITISEAEPQFLYSGQIHGDELLTSILMLRLIDHLLNNYNSDIQVNRLVNNIEIWINPLANPDGLYAGGDETVNFATRFNANGVDLNRNFPDAILGDHPDGNTWQSETQAFMALADEQHFVMSANSHAGTMVVNYPWDFWSVRHADDLWWQLVSHEYADLAQLNSPPGYMEAYNNGITNGYDWYSIHGGRQDYMTYFQQCREFTLELSTLDMLPSNELPAYWEYNRQAMLYYLEQVTYGFRGKVTDQDTGDAILAKIEINGHDFDNSHVFSDSLGYYYRPIKAGTYTLNFSADGYVAESVSNQLIGDYDTKTIDVKLQKLSSGIEDEFLSKLQITNPVQNHILHITSLLNIYKIKIYSILGQLIYTDKTNSNELQLDIQNFKSGVYIVDIEFSNGKHAQQRFIIP
ncbi:MAG: M14 family zinc carboxypeptidase [Bacteroidales bacterium]|jgi:hypothetical protein|nr:M14 family zinc carboxypeptidase [Bacteroidales bacterium]